MQRPWEECGHGMRACIATVSGHKVRRDCWARTFEVLKVIEGKCVFLKNSLIKFNWRLITLQYCGGFCHTLTWISHGCTCAPHLEPPSPVHPSGLSQCPGVECLFHASNLHWSSFTYGDIHVAMLFYQIIPSSPSPTESKSLFSISVSLLLSCI